MRGFESARGPLSMQALLRNYEMQTRPSKDDIEALGRRLLGSPAGSRFAGGRKATSLRRIAWARGWSLAALAVAVAALVLVVFPVPEERGDLVRGGHIADVAPDPPLKEAEGPADPNAMGPRPTHASGGPREAAPGGPVRSSPAEGTRGTSGRRPALEILGVRGLTRESLAELEASLVGAAQACGANVLEVETDRLGWVRALSSPGSTTSLAGCLAQAAQGMRIAPAAEGRAGVGGPSPSGGWARIRVALEPR